MGYIDLDLNLPPPVDREAHQESQPPSPSEHGGEKVEENEEICIPKSCYLEMPEDDSNDVLQDEGLENKMKTNCSSGDNLEKAEGEEGKKCSPEEEMGKREEDKMHKNFEALLDAVEEASVDYENDGDLKTKAKHNPSEAGKPEMMVDESSGRKRRPLNIKIEEDQQTPVEILQQVSTSPVVKSNRGRNQVLPYKYRDSVMEPLTQLSSRHRRSTAADGPTKRRSRCSSPYQQSRVRKKNN